MSRIETLSILLEKEGKDFLSEEYGKVIENIEKNTISSQLKNRDLSGDPSAGTVEAKRFANAISKDYGTARTNAKGENVKVKPVTVPIDIDKEIIEEIEQKDVSLYGINDVVSRRIANHQKALARELERSFFKEGFEEGTEITFTASTDITKLEEIIQKVETVKNEYVDGVERDMISVIMPPSEYSNIRIYLDTNTNNANVPTSSAEFGTLHGVKVYSSVYLPEGCTHLVMADGAIAQPVMPTVAAPEKIQLSNAYGFGLYYSYGTKCVMPDLIFYAGDFSTPLNDLTVTSQAGTNTGDSKITVIPTKARGNHYVYKVGASITVPTKWEDVSSWTEWDGTSDITATTGQTIGIVESNKYKKAIKGGCATVTAKA